ncbi:hypothetical protein [Promicromonospora umidemergens]|uniref:hypothetical protein n=1 Tax=Promicromonospora umidemergens TaxID=629679 RepID=UPI0020A4CFFB|nr:hypothetical protein [Promicromonospora umidemergens]
MSEIGALPRGTTVLHIGAPKTGTTSLQQSAAGARTRLREGGVLYPGQQENHHRVARSLLGHRREPWHADLAPAHWAKRILSQLTDNGLDYGLVSSETFSTARARDVARVREAFPMPTHVVLTLRSLPGMLLSMWQQRVKNGEPELLEAWLNDAFRDLPMLHMPGADVFDESDGTNLVGRWADAFGPENMTVVVLDPTDRDHNFQTFEDLLAQPRGTLDRVNANSGMNAIETEFFRRAAERITRETGSSVRRELFHGGAVNAVISERSRRPDEPALRMPEWARAHATTAAVRIAEQIESAGVRVVGDVADLAAPGRFGNSVSLPEEIGSDLALIAAGGIARRTARLREAKAKVRTTHDADRSKSSGGLSDAATLLISGAPGSCVDAVRRVLTRGSAELREKGVRYFDGLVAPSGNGPHVLVSETAWSYTADEIRGLPGAQDGRLTTVVVVEAPALLAVRSWQDEATRGAVQDFDGYLAELLSGTGVPVGGRPVLGHDPVGPWVEAIGAEKVIVVVPPAQDHMLLASVVDAIVCRSAGLVTRLAAGERTGDRRLSATEAEFLAGLNEHLTNDGGPYDVDVRRMRSSAVRRLLDARVAGVGEGVIGVPEWALGQVQAVGKVLADRIAAYGVRTEGDLADLAAVPLPETVRTGRSEQIPSELGLQAVMGVYEGAKFVV